MPDLLVVCLVYVLVAALLGAALALLARCGRRLGLTDWQAAGFGLVCVGCAGYLGFFAYWLSPAAGTVVSLASGAVVIVAAPRVLWKRPMPRELAQAMRLAALFGLAYLSLLFWYVSAYSADVPAEVYFEWPRSHDQRIPLMFAEAVFDRLPSRTGRDIWGWHPSDRPPLQAGFVLLFSPLWAFVPRPAAYQAVATALQVSCLVALWLLLRTLGLRYRETLLAVAVTGASGFLYYNAVYAWPKLLAATFVLVAIASPARAFLARERLGAVPAAIAAAAAALAILSHGGAFYSLAPLAILLCVRPATLPGWRSIAAAVAAVIMLYGPWVAYGHAVDPNTGRLLKLHLTDGDIDTPEPFWQVLLRSYRTISAAQWAERRLENLRRHFSDPRLDRLIVQVAYGVRDVRLRTPLAPEPWDGVRPNALRHDLASLGTLLRVDQREIVLRALGPLNAAWPLLIVLVLRRRHGARGLDPPLAFLLALNALTVVVWSVVQFRGGSTVITHASFAMMLIAFATPVVILARVSPRAARIVCGANLAWSILVWVLLAPGSYWQEPRNGVAGALSIAAAAAIVALLRAWWRAANDAVAGECSPVTPLRHASIRAPD